MLETSLRQNEPVALPERPFGRVARSIAAHVLVTLVMTVTPMLVFVPAALLHCGLRNGRRAAWLAGAITLALFALPVMFSPAAKPDGSVPGLVSVALVAFAIMLPTLLALPLVERGTNFGRVLVFLIGTSFLGLAATEAVSRAALQVSPYAMQATAFSELTANAVDVYRKNGVPASDLRNLERSSRASLVILPALLIISLSFVFALSLLMLGRLRVWRELAAARGTRETFGAYLFRNLSLPDWVLFAFIVGGLTPLASGMLQKVAANTLTVVAFLYVLQGLAIFRFLLLSMGAGFIQSMFGWLILGLLTVLTGLPVLLLGVAGLFDSFFDFRHFKKRKDDSHESHSD